MRRQKTDTCYCTGYPFPHRWKSLYCEDNPGNPLHDETSAAYKARYALFEEAFIAMDAEKQKEFVKSTEAELSDYSYADEYRY